MNTKIAILTFQIILVLSLLASCSNESPYAIPSTAQNESETTIPLSFNAAPPLFDSTSTRAAYSWPDGSRLFFKFYDSNNNGFTTGTGIYSSASGEWTLSYKGSIEADKGLSCEVWFFENAEAITDKSVKLLPTSCIYYDLEAEYLLYDGKMSIDANLCPESARMQFSGTPGTSLTIGCWPRHETFNVSTCLFSDVTDPFSLTVGSDGFTPYFFGHISNTDTKLEVIVNSYSYYYRLFESGQIKNGRSHLLMAPNEDLVTQNVWSVVRTFTVTGNGKTVTFTMKKVEGGTFQMGSTSGDSDETPVHSVTLTKDYYMGETEVTQALWYAVWGYSPTSGGPQWSSIDGLGDERPAYYISYEDCQSFLTALNSKLSSQLYSGENFRFPTETEWEFAAKGGNKTNNYTYAGSNTIGEVAWYNGNSYNYGSYNYSTHVVKTKSSNELGLYDMSGNVCEWCYDWYGSYSSSAQTDPIGPSSGSKRMLRGGHYYNINNYCRVAYRAIDLPSNRSKYIGFRLCLAAPLPDISVTPSFLSFDASASSLQLAVSANGEYTYSSSASWLTITQSSDKATLTVSARANVGTSARTATITLTLGSLSKTVSVTQSSRKEKFFTVTGNGKTVTFKMIKVEGGTFQMGSTSGVSGETPVHSVTLTKDYYMGETEVTQALWYAVMGYSPTSGGSQWSSTNGLGDERPAYYISYEDCQSFLTALNSKLASQLSSGESFRFPTEAEWEFAAKGGNKSNGYTYSGSNTIGEVAWYNDNSYALGSSNANYGTHVVKTKSPNELGLYDMSGNVWEWCYDWWGLYSSGAQTDPTGPSSGSSRVLRGGSWVYNASACRVATRTVHSPSDGFDNFGFRLCLGAPIE